MIFTWRPAPVTELSHPAATFSGVQAIASYFGFFVTQVPVLAVLVAGLVVLSSSRRRLPGRSNTLARAGLGLLLAETVASLIWNITFTQLISRSTFSVAQFGLINGLISFIFAMLFAVGLGLLIAALAMVRSEAAKSAAGEL